MKIIITLILSVSLIATSFSQCDIIIPSSAIAYNSNGSHSVSNETIWICPGVTITLTGHDNIVYVEKDVILTLTSGGNTATVKDHGHVEIEGDFNKLYVAPNATFSNIGASNSTLGCPSVSFDYTNAPSGVCPVTTGLVDNDLNNGISIYPNPVDNILYIINEGKISLTSFQIYNNNGQLMQEGIFDGKNENIDVSSLSKGGYILNLNTENGSYKKSITKK
jgi:hypothetical protein